VSAADMLDDSFPHGTMNGYRQGCKTGHCPAPITCSTVRTRYVSDWAFRKRVDAGWTVQQIADADQAEADERREAERAANRRIREAVKRERKVAERSARRRTSAPTHSGPSRIWTADELEKLRTMNAAGVPVADIAIALDRTRHSVWTKRKALDLPTDRPGPAHGTPSRWSAGCKGDDCPATPSCTDAVRVYWRERAEAKRRRGVRAQPTEADYAEARRMYAAGNVTLTEIATQLGMSRKTVAKVVGSTGERPKLTQCPQGHEFNEANTYLNVRDGKTRRACRPCRNDQSARRRAAA
jgi:predicted DNA-binding protein (UPF0251 family)